MNRLVYGVTIVGRVLGFVGELLGIALGSLFVVYIMGFLVSLPTVIAVVATTQAIGIALPSWLPVTLAVVLVLLTGSIIGIKTNQLGLDEIRSVNSPFESYKSWATHRSIRKFNDHGTDAYPDDWDELRHRVYRRDNYSCVNCGARDVELHAHHIVPLSRGGTNNVSNIITLCRDCHQRLHPHMR